MIEGALDRGELMNGAMGGNIVASARHRMDRL